MDEKRPKQIVSSVLSEMFFKANCSFCATNWESSTSYWIIVMTCCQRQQLASQSSPRVNWRDCGAFPTMNNIARGLIVCLWRSLVRNWSARRSQSAPLNCWTAALDWYQVITSCVYINHIVSSLIINLMSCFDATSWPWSCSDVICKYFLHN